MPPSATTLQKFFSPPYLHRTRRLLFLAGAAIVIGVAIYGLVRPHEPGADWFAPVNGPKRDDWAKASQLALPWMPRTNETLGVRCEFVKNSAGKQELEITTESVDAKNKEIRGICYADLIRANTDNAATLPDGTVVRLAEVIAYPGANKPPLFFKLTGKTSSPVKSSTAPLLDKDAADHPLLQFVLNPESAKAVDPREFFIFDSDTGRLLVQGSGKNEGNLISYGIPYMPQAPLHLLLRCHYDGTQQISVPATAGKTAATNGIAIRYCGSMTREANEYTSYHLYSVNPPPATGLFSTTLPERFHSSGLSHDRKANQIFIFAQAIGALEILSAKAILESGEEISLTHIDRKHTDAFRAFQGPAQTKAPIRSFLLTLPKRSARVAFSIPQIQELWPTQNTKNRFDLRFSAAEAEQFKYQSYLPFEDRLRGITGIHSSYPLGLKPEETYKWPSLNDVELTGKTIREVFTIYLQQCDSNPADFTTAIDREGNNVFERKKSAGIYIGRWLYRHGIFQWLGDRNMIGWLDKVGIKPG